MRRTYECGTKARLCGGSHAPVNMADNREVNVGERTHRKWPVFCAALYIARQVFANP